MQAPQRHGTNGTDVPIRPAASLLTIRDIGCGVEVLALKRSEAMRFLPGHLAFPGGSVGLEDSEDSMEELVCKTEARFVTALPDNQAYEVAAIRECAEETGLLCAINSAGAATPAVERLTLWEQRELLAGKLPFHELLRQRKVCLATSQLRFVGRWITPPGMSARFDTRFFLYVVAKNSIHLEPSVSENENEWVRWEKPGNLLSAIACQQEKAMPPTIAMLEALESFSSVAECEAQLSVPGPFTL